MAPRTLSATCDGWHTFNATIFDPVRIAAIAHLRYAPMRERGAIIMKGSNAAEFRVAHHSASGLWDLIPTLNSTPAAHHNAHHMQSALTASLSSATAADRPAHHHHSPSPHTHTPHIESPMLFPSERAVMSAVKRSAAHRRFAITLSPNRHFVLHPSASGSRHFVLVELHAGPRTISFTPRPAPHKHDDDDDDGIQVASFTCDGVWKRSYSIHIERLIPDEVVVFCFWLVNLMNRRANRADPTHAAHATKG